MANSITLSQSLVDDIAQKITDGTATAEQVVLYTKGLNQLQTGNDFQSVVIGLSQSAVDAIDSANAQFQEDAQNALDTFSQTATNIDTSATNAVSAINIAKDTLVATDAEITSTIDSLPSKTSIEESQKWSIHEYTPSGGQSGYTSGAGVGQNAPHWDGVHDLPRIWKGYVEHKEFDTIHPWNAPAYLVWHRLSGVNGFFSVRNSFNEIMDQIGIVATSTDDTAAATAYLLHKYRVHYGYHALTSSHSYIFDYLSDSPSSNSGQRINGTTQLGPYGQGRYMHMGEAWRGLSEGFVYTTNTTGNNSRRSSSMGYGTIVGTTHKDWTITRPWANNQVYLSSSRKIADAQYDYMNRSDFETDSGNSPFSDGTQSTEKSKIDFRWGKGYTGDWTRHERLRFNSFRNTGMGNLSYNANTNKFLYVDVNSSSPYEKQLKLMSVDSSFNLRNIALGKQSIGQKDYDPISNNKMTVEIDSQVDMRAAADAVTSISRTDSYDDHIGQVVLCDNDTVVMGWQYTHSANRFRIVRAIKNSANDDYQYDTQWNRTLQTCYQDYDYYGPTHRVTNDGRYVAMFTHDYYYGGGINGVFIRVADGAVLQFEVHNTGAGVFVVPVKHDEFYVGYQNDTNYKYRLSMEYMFENFADGTDVSDQFFKGTQHAEYPYQYGVPQQNNLDRHRNSMIYPIYQPYNYLTQYYNTDGTRKSEYDRNLNLIS